MIAGSMQIRSASPGDAGALARLRYEFRAALDPARESAEGFIVRCEQWMKRRLVPGSPWRAWVAEQDGEVVGMAWAMIIDKLPNPVSEPECHGYVSSLYLRPDCRGHGGGSALLSQCIAACESQGCDAIFLWPTARSRALYQRHGFAMREDLFERRVTAPPKHV